MLSLEKNCLSIEFCTLSLECCDFIYFSVAINIVMNSSSNLVRMAKANGSFCLVCELARSRN
jgi:hypothetical protein